MLVYRYEDEAGHGPFAGQHLAWDFTDAMLEAGRYPECDDPDDPDCWHNRFPTHWEEGLDDDDMDDGVCGFSSIRQAVRWFPKPCREIMARNGLVLEAFEVPDDAVLIGDHQVVFDRDKATPVSLRVLALERQQLALPLAA